jgi:two-component system nitrate/nitrite response regulator NarL
MTANTPLLLVVDDHPLMLEGLVQIAGQALPGHRLLQASNFADARRLSLGDQPPQLVLLDPGLPDLHGLAAIQGMVKALPAGAVVVISANDQPQDQEAAWVAGARGFISKGAPPEALMAGLQAVAQGRRVLVTRQQGLNEAPAPPAEQAGLSARQLEVLAAICEGQSNKQIGQRLEITEKTVKAHVSAIFDKLKVANRTQATLAAQRLQLVPLATAPPVAREP